MLAVDPAGVSAAGLRAHLGDLDRLRATVDRATLAATGVLEAMGGFADDGAVTAAQWLSHRCELSSHGARVNVRVARRLASMPVVAAAAEAGELGPDKVRVLALARTPDRAEVFAEHEAWLVDLAGRYTVDETAHLVRHWCRRVDGRPSSSFRKRAAVPKRSTSAGQPGSGKANRLVHTDRVALRPYDAWGPVPRGSRAG